MDCREPHPAPNEKTQPIQWTERPTGALVAVNSLWPTGGCWFTVADWQFMLIFLPIPHIRHVREIVIR
jgi:hypothetical protein